MRPAHPLLVRVFGWPVNRFLRRPPIYFSKLRCPHCGKHSTDQMPGNASVYFYRCTRCNGVVKPKPGQCCVYCSYGNVPCPWRQQGNAA